MRAHERHSTMLHLSLSFLLSGRRQATALRTRGSRDGAPALRVRPGPELLPAQPCGERRAGAGAHIKLEVWMNFCALSETIETDVCSNHS